MPPKNCIRALIWGSIMEGANGTMCFSYDPYSRKYNPDSSRDAVENYRTERFYVDLAGRPGGRGAMGHRHRKNVVAQRLKLDDFD
jgi:hypothetical protein